MRRDRNLQAKKVLRRARSVDTQIHATQTDPVVVPLVALDQLPLLSRKAIIVYARQFIYVWTDEETIAQVHSIGPWSVNYINPADDPTKN